MTEKGDTNQKEDHIQKLIEGAIQSEIGDIDRLPHHIAARIRDVYGKFIPIYLEMIRIRENHPRDWRPGVLPLEPDMLEDMLHFFSDHQHITRAFMRLNRRVQLLATLDPEKDSRRYTEVVESIVSDEVRTSLMDSLLDRPA